MATLKQALKRANKVQSNNISRELFSIIKSIQKDIIEINKNQLSQGKDVYEKTIGLYSRATEAITTNQYLLGQRKDIKREGTPYTAQDTGRSEEHTSELQSRENLVCRLLLEKKKKIIKNKVTVKVTKTIRLI